MPAAASEQQKLRNEKRCCQEGPWEETAEWEDHVAAGSKPLKLNAHRKRLIRIIALLLMVAAAITVRNCCLATFGHPYFYLSKTGWEWGMRANMIIGSDGQSREIGRSLCVGPFVFAYSYLENIQTNVALPSTSPQLVKGTTNQPPAAERRTPQVIKRYPTDTNLLYTLVGRRVQFTGALVDTGKHNYSLSTTNGLIELAGNVEFEDDVWKQVTVDGTIELQKAFRVPEDADTGYVQTNLRPGQQLPDRFLLRAFKLVHQ
jgi:hypothetical protein